MQGPFRNTCYSSPKESYTQSHSIRYRFSQLRMCGSPDGKGVFRMINLTCGLSHPTFKIRVTKQVRSDLYMWAEFLNFHNGVPIRSTDVWTSSDSLCMSTDAAQSKGYAAVLKNQWLAGSWSPEEQHSHISVLEFYPILLAVLLWEESLKNKNILFLCDNSNNNS